MKLSVLVPAYNESSVIVTTLARVHAVLSPHEVFVTDGCSTDDTAAIAAAYGHVLTRRMSRGALLNYAASLATGDVFLVLHADTLLPLNAAAVIASALEDADVVGGAFRLCLDDPSLTAGLVAQSVNLRTALLNSFFGDQAMFVRREVFERVGGFRDWSVMEDLDIVGRLRHYGRLKIVDATVMTSARRHRSNGWMKTITTIWGICLLNRRGVPGHVLIRWYQPRR